MNAASVYRSVLKRLNDLGCVLRDYKGDGHTERVMIHCCDTDIETALYYALGEDGGAHESGDRCRPDRARCNGPHKGNDVDRLALKIANALQDWQFQTSPIMGDGTLMPASFDIRKQAGVIAQVLRQG